MSKFNTKKTRETVTNYMGETAYKQSPELELTSAILTTFVEEAYYEATDTRLDRIKMLCREVSPTYLAKLAVYARTKANMRSVFPVLIGELSKIDKGTGLTRKAIATGTTRVDDVTEIVSYLGRNNITTQVKKGISRALGKFDEYQFAKYQGKKRDYGLVDVVNLTHPKPTAKNKVALEKLVAGTLKNTATWEAKLSAGESKQETFKELLETDRLGYMALLRNLRNIATDCDQETVELAAILLADEQRVLKSKQLPFRYLSAYEALRTTTGLKFEKDRENVEILKGALEAAVSTSVRNIPLLTGRTMILSDNSGSMGGDFGGRSTTSSMAKTSTANIANLFATLYYLRADNTYIGLFGDRLIEPKLDRNASVFDNFDTISREAGKCGGSTERGIFDCFENLVKTKTKVDRVVIFSDCQVGRGCGWYDREGNRGDNFNALFKQYKKINPDVKVYSIDLKGYGKDMFDEGVCKISGWSDKIFDIIEKAEQNPNALVDEVKAIEL